MNFMTLNKVAGAGLGALLLFLLLGFFSEQAVRGEKHHDDVLAYALDVDSGDSEPAPAEEIDYAALVSNADVSNGEGIFRQCSACHKIEEGKNGVGPHLWEVVGRPIGAVDAYSYSNALAGMDGAWTLENLSGFLKNPSEWAPGTKMGYAGLSDPQDRVDVIAYLNEEGESNVELAAAEAASMSDAAEEAPAEETAEPMEAAEAEAPAEEATEMAASEEASEETTTETAASGEAAEETTETAATENAAEETTETAATEEAAEETTETAATEETTETAATETAAAEEATEETAETAATDEASEETTETAAAEEATEEDTEVAMAEETEAPAETAPATEEAEATPAAASGSMFASVDAAEGEKVWRQCRACHVADKEQNRVGPHLVGVVGREVASVDGYNYSSAMQSYGGAWTPDRLAAYLEDPRGVVQGTKMAYRGLKDEADRLAIIKWLNEQAPNPVELP